MSRHTFDDIPLTEIDGIDLSFKRGGYEHVKGILTLLSIMCIAVAVLTIPVPSILGLFAWGLQIILLSAAVLLQVWRRQYTHKISAIDVVTEAHAKELTDLLKALKKQDRAEEKKDKRHSK